jgi:hypothetical protein
MYLARIKKKNHTHYMLRQSFQEGGCYKSRDLFNLGTDPSHFIIYPGGNGYYLDPVIADSLARAGIEVNDNQLDKIFFEFLKPEIQRVIAGFDRCHRRSNKNAQKPPLPWSSAHAFDKRRFHYLRYGHSSQRFIARVPEKYFHPLRGKSRDELEHYFLAQESNLKHYELPAYIAAIFSLNQFVPEADTQRSIQFQRDAYFIRQLCRLYRDDAFWQGMPRPQSLGDYLAKYAIIYFDWGLPMEKPAWMTYIEEFINAHRIHKPPAKVRAGMERAARMFGKSWKELKIMDRTDLTRLYRRLALKHHPDQGGDSNTFLQLTQIYQVLLRQKPKQ